MKTRFYLFAILIIFANLYTTSCEKVDIESKEDTEFIESATQAYIRIYDDMLKSIHRM